MTRKIHLAANKGLNGNALVARCAGTVRNNRIQRNQRSAYQFMASAILPWEEFKAADRDSLCAHCVDVGLVARNRQRKAKGLPTVATLFDN